MIGDWNLSPAKEASSSTRRLVECVPNFSEGRDIATIDAIAGAIRAVEGVRLLNVEPNGDYNRTVVTFVGHPDGVVEAAFQATRVAAELIDMRRHTGGHPRIGAADVVPFVPISGVTMDDCVKLANRYGLRVGEELNVPVYLYEEAARVPQRRNLATVRKGEYEGLAAKLADPEWRPDYGEPAMNERSGATVTGARTFLIAYNVNLATDSQPVAHEIALRIRESGRPMRGDDGQIVRDSAGKSITIPGSLKSVKAMGVLLEKHHIAQVSINLTNYEITPPHAAFEQVAVEAKKLGTQATGSEIVGLTPRTALLVAGRHYANGREMTEEAFIALAIERLGLSQLEPFDPKKKIIEYMLES